MTDYYPIVLEIEENGAVSAYVPGLPVYAAAESSGESRSAIRAVMPAYLEAHPASRPDAQVRVARFSDRGKTKVDIVGVAARSARSAAQQGERLASKRATCRSTSQDASTTTRRAKTTR